MQRVRFVDELMNLGNNHNSLLIFQKQRENRVDRTS